MKRAKKTAAKINAELDALFATEPRSIEPRNEQRSEVNEQRSEKRLPSLFTKRGRGPNDLSEGELERALEIVSRPRGTLTRAAEACGVSEMTMYRALTERCSDAYTRARKQRASGHAHNIEGLIDDIKTGAVAPDAGRVILDGLKWLAERMDRGLWGPQAEVQPADPTVGALAALGAAAMREQLAAMVGALGIVGTVMPGAARVAEPPALDAAKPDSS